MNPLMIVLLVAALVAGGAYGGWKAANEHRDALELSSAVGKAEALNAAGRAIAGLTVVNTTIRQTLETQVREKPVYVDCKNTPEVMATVNKALQGSAP